MAERLMVEISLELSDLLAGENLGWPDVRVRLNNFTDNFEARVYASTGGYSGNETVLFAGEGATAEAAMESLVTAVKSAQAARSSGTCIANLDDLDLGGES